MISSSGSGKQGNGRRILQGMLLLASGRREGIGCFQGTPDSFGAALAPQLALLLVGIFQASMQADKVLGFTKLLLSLCVVLLPAVISHFYAPKWGRDALWLRSISASTGGGWGVVRYSLRPRWIQPSLFRTSSIMEGGAQIYSLEPFLLT